MTININIQTTLGALPALLKKFDYLHIDCKVTVDIEDVRPETAAALARPEPVVTAPTPSPYMVDWSWDNLNTHIEERLKSLPGGPHGKLALMLTDTLFNLIAYIPTGIPPLAYVREVARWIRCVMMHRTVWARVEYMQEHYISGGKVSSLSRTAARDIEKKFLRPLRGFGDRLRPALDALSTKIG